MGVEVPNNGLFQRYNGIDVFQTRDYVKLSAESYMTKAKREAERQARESSPSSSEQASTDSQAPNNDAPGSMRRGGPQASVASNSISSMLRRTYVSFNDSDDESF